VAFNVINIWIPAIEIEKQLCYVFCVDESLGLILLFI